MPESTFFANQAIIPAAVVWNFHIGWASHCKVVFSLISKSRISGFSIPGGLSLGQDSSFRLQISPWLHRSARGFKRCSAKGRNVQARVAKQRVTGLQKAVVRSFWNRTDTDPIAECDTVRELDDFMTKRSIDAAEKL